MDSLDKTLQQVSKEVIDKMLSLEVQVTAVIDGPVLVGQPDENNFLRLYVQDSELTETDQLLSHGEYDTAVQLLTGKDILPATRVTFVIVNQEPVLFGGFSGDQVLEIEDLIDLGDRLKVSVVPLIFKGILDDIQRKSLISWCRLSPEEREEKLGGTSFTRFIITLLTGQDPEELPWFAEINGVLKGFTFMFSNENQAYLSEIVDPAFQTVVEPQQEEPTTSEDIIRVFLDFFKKHGVILDGDSFVQRAEKNFVKVIDSDSEVYNYLIQLSANYNWPKKVYTKGSKLSTEFSNRLNSNDLVARLFNLFISVFGKSTGVPSELSEEVSKYITKMNK